MDTDARDHNAMMAQFKKTTRDANLKVTSQRTAIYDVVAAARDHPGVEEIRERLPSHLSEIAIDTVYRTMGSLEDLGLVRRVAGVGERSRYDPVTTWHGHFICTACHAIHSVDCPLPESFGWEQARALGRVREVQWIARGICHACAKDAPNIPDAQNAPSASPSDETV